MTREWKAGDVGITGERMPDEPQVRFMVSGDDEDGLRFRYADGVTLNFPPRDDARPLIVIDPEDREQLDRACKAIVEACYAHGNTVTAHNGIHSDTLAAALRTLIAPPKPPEPQNRYAVVVDRDGTEWLRSKTGVWYWQVGLTYQVRHWDNIDAVKVLSEGVTA